MKTDGLASKPETKTKVATRKKAPKVRVLNRSEVNERQEIVRMFAPDAIDVQEEQHVGVNKMTATGKHINKLHAFFGDPNVRPEVYEADGYTAVTKDGEHITHRGDPLYTLPQDEYEENRAVGEEISRQSVETSVAGEDDTATQMGLSRGAAG